VLAEATPVLKELNLTNEQADKLTPIAAQLVKKTMDRAEAAITDRAIQNRKEWAEAFDKDPEIGGANKAQTVAFAAKAFDHYGLKKGEGLASCSTRAASAITPTSSASSPRRPRSRRRQHDRGGRQRSEDARAEALRAEFQPKG
jgi:hypothetical protein